MIPFKETRRKNSFKVIIASTKSNPINHSREVNSVTRTMKTYSKPDKNRMINSLIL